MKDQINKVKKEILSQIALGNMENVLKRLLEISEESDQTDLHTNLILLSGRYHRNNNANLNGTISDANYNMELNRINNALTNYVREEFEVPEGMTGYTLPNDIKEEKKDEGDLLETLKSVFISYSHKESVYALKLKASLEAQNVKVIIDVNDLAAGGDIKSFIEESIKKASNTISIISMNSLLSSWVSIEVIKTIDSEHITDKKFIAAFIDDAFFKRSYPDDALDEIEKEISEIKQLIKQRLDKGRNIDDLQSELTRYKDLKHYFPRIIKRLNDSLSVDIRDAQFEKGVTSILAALI